MLSFAIGVKATQKDGLRVRGVSIIPLTENIPAPPSGATMFSLAYEFGPEASTYTPGITLTLSYDPAKLPSGFNPANLVLMTYNTATKAWEAITPTTLDTVNHTVSATVAHFSIYALFGTMRPASLAMRGVDVSATEVNIGEAVTVRAAVANAGDLQGDYTVTFKVNGETMATEKVSLGGGGSTSVDYSFTPDKAGTYEIDVNGSRSTVNVWAVGPVGPEFVLKSLAIFPYESTYGEEAIISVVAENNGDAAITRTVIFKIDGTVVSTREVSLAPHSKKSVEYTTSNSEVGERAVDVNGIKAAFNVRPLLIAPTTVSINWYLIALIIFAVTALTSTVGFRLRNRTRYVPPVPPPVRRRQ
jgi:hypothetical protein